MPQIPQPNAGLIPYYIFDIIMPLCRSWAEERVIMYIARNTRGYGEDEGWITKAQMVKGKKYTKKDHKWVGEIVCLGTGLSRPSVNKGIDQALEDGWILERILCPACQQVVSQSETEIFGAKAITRKVVAQTCPHCSAPLRGREQFWYRLNFSKDTQYSPKQAIEDLLKSANEGIKERLIPLLKALKWGGLKALKSGDVSSFNGGIKEPLIKEENKEIEKKEREGEKEKEAADAAPSPPLKPKKPKVLKDPVEHALTVKANKADKALASPNVPSPEYFELVCIHANALGIPPPEGKEGQAWARKYQEIVKKVGNAWGLDEPGEAFALTKKALERLAGTRGTKDGNFWWSVWSSPRCDSLQEKLIAQAGRLVVQTEAIEPWDSRTGEERPAAVVVREPKTEQQKTWDEVLAILRQQMAKGTFNSLLKGTRCVAQDDGILVVEVNTAFIKDWLDNRLAIKIRQAVAEVTPLAVEFRVREKEETT